MLVAMTWRRQIAVILTSGCFDSSTMARLSSSVKLRRFERWSRDGSLFLGLCQDRFDTILLSNAANTAAYFRAGARMKIRSPIDLPLGGIEEITPAPRTVHREMVRECAMRGGQFAPGQRFDVHQPERLDGDRSPRFAQQRGTAAAPLMTLLAQKFRCFPCGFGPFQLRQPAIERRLRQPMLATIFGAWQPLRRHASMCVAHHGRRASFWNRFDATGDPPLYEGTRNGPILHPPKHVSEPDAYRY